MPGTVSSLNGSIAQLPIQTTKQIVRKKVVDVEPEPKYTRVDEHVQPLELFISANCDYSRFRCKTNAIRFKDTLMFQTRVYEYAIDFIHCTSIWIFLSHNFFLLSKQ